MTPCAVDEPADKRNAERVPAQRGRGVRGDVLPAGQAVCRARGRDRAAQGRGYDAVGRTDEQHPQPCRGGRDEGVCL